MDDSNYDMLQDIMTQYDILHGILYDIKLMYIKLNILHYILHNI